MIMKAEYTGTIGNSATVHGVKGNVWYPLGHNLWGEIITENRSKCGRVLTSGGRQDSGELTEVTCKACQRAIWANRRKIAYTMWVCQCCMFTHANGECCDSDEHGGDGREPLSQVASYEQVTSGLPSSEHEDDCLQRRVRWADLPGDDECECETDTFSWSTCGGCGSTLGGTRHAMTVFQD